MEEITWVTIGEDKSPPAWHTIFRRWEEGCGRGTAGMVGEKQSTWWFTLTHSLNHVSPLTFSPQVLATYICIQCIHCSVPRPCTLLSTRSPRTTLLSLRRHSVEHHSLHLFVFQIWVLVTQRFSSDWENEVTYNCFASFLAPCIWLRYKNCKSIPMKYS